MANFYGTARTNYFKVKDVEAFTEFVESINCVLIDYVIDGEKMYGFYSDDPDSGCFPSCRYNEETDQTEDINLVDEVAKHLVECEICIMMEAGAEKMRYIFGWATAFNHTGEYVNLSLSDIYKMAKDKFSKEPTVAEY